ncbi:MAG: hypothetical protein IKQ39_06415 [Oscillospiraceae bacterium]|nr:hypothetical protein [Oscillospiraceae bacterium]
MKSLFKRTLATATGSVLALSQLVSVANVVNISAEDSTLPPVDKSYVLSVTFDKEDPLAAGQTSGWADDVESKFLELQDHTYSYSSQKVKNALARELKKEKGLAKYLSSEDIDALVGQIAPQITGKTSADGSFSAELTINEIGDIVGDITQDLYTETGVNLHDDAGDPIVVDWSAFKMSGKIVVSGKVNFDEKKITYETTIIDETGKEYKNDAGIEQYAKDKLAQAKQVALDATNGKSATKYTKRVNELADSIDTKIGYIRLIADAIAGISFSDQTSADAAYTMYTDSLTSKIEGSGIPAGVADRVNTAIDNRKPASATGVITSERFNSFFTKAINTLNNNSEGVTIDLSTSDVVSVLNQGYEYDIDVPDGYSADLFFKYQDEEQNKVLDAVKAVYTDNGFITGSDLKDLAALAADDKYQDYKVVDGSGAEVTDFDKDYTVIGVTSHKEITAYAHTEYVVKGELFFDVERVIEQIIVEKVEPTTTTTTETTSSTTTTESTTTESTTTESTTTETTTTETTTLATYVSFEVGGAGENELVYWSEETDATFDFSEIQIMAHFVVAGEDQTEDVVDVSEFFAAAANSPAELGVKDDEVGGVLKTPVDLILKDEDGLKAVIASKNYDADAIMADQGFAQGKAVSYFYVVLVLRGDFDLDGKVNARDAQMALSYYVDALALKTPKNSIDSGRLLPSYDNPFAVLPYAHYAGDITGDGEIQARDAQWILQYYVRTLSLHGWDWDQVTSNHFVPAEILHVDPLKYDEVAKQDYIEYRDAQ